MSMSDGSGSFGTCGRKALEDLLVDLNIILRQKCVT
jgi:hypothetical protein